MRVRFAPSPTGALHIGGARTALFNWLLARHGGGALVLRIEDTDRERSTPENVEQILDALRWLEIDWDEGPVLQTDRSERHQEALQAMLDGGHAYRTHATGEDVKAFKELYGADRGYRGKDEGDGAVLDLITSGGGGVGMMSTWPIVMTFAFFRLGLAAWIAFWVTLNFWAILMSVSFFWTV